MMRVLAPVLLLAFVAGICMLIWHFNRIGRDRTQIVELSKRDPATLRLVVEQNARLQKRIPKEAVDELVRRHEESVKDKAAIDEMVAIAERLLARPETYMLGEEHDPLKEWVESQKTDRKVSN